MFGMFNYTKSSVRTLSPIYISRKMASTSDKWMIEELEELAKGNRPGY